MDTGTIKFTEDQQKAFDCVMSGADTFITGGAGTGKSFLINKLISALEKQGKSTIVCAPTGAAAIHVGGITIHRAFGFSIGPCFTETGRHLSVRAPKLICKADVIIIDEISMCRMDMMDAISASIQKARTKSGHPIQVVVIGDFYQLPPVISEDKNERQILERFYKKPVGNAFAFQAPGWDALGFRVIQLHETIRQNDPEFIGNLNRIRNGDVSAIRYFNNHATKSNKETAINVYANNNDVNCRNLEELRKIPYPETIFQPIYYGEVPEKNLMTEPLVLKKDAEVIITMNDNREGTEDIGAALNMYRYTRSDTFHNGSTGTILELVEDPDDPEKEYVIVRINNGRIIKFHRQEQVVYDYYLDENQTIQKKAVGRILQFPLKLGYAITIHRSQGQTYDEMNFEPKCWCSGQLYVALSRLRSIEGLHLLRDISVKDLRLDPVVKKFYENLGSSKSVSSKKEMESFLEQGGDTEPIDPTPAADVIQLPVETGTANEEKQRKLVQIPVFDEKPDELPPKTEMTGKKANKGDKKDVTTSLPDNTGSVQEETEVSSKTRGRPSRFPNGSVVIRIPKELSFEITRMLNIICPKGGLNEKELEKFRKILQETCDLSNN